MFALRSAEAAIMDLVIQLHWVAGEVPDAVVAQHLRSVADQLNASAMELRSLWELRHRENLRGPASP